MKKAILLAATAILMASGTAMADVKIKTKQTMGGTVSENTTYIKGKRTRTEMMNGVMISLTQCDLKRDLQLNPQTKTYVVNLYDDGTVSEPTKIRPGTSVPATKGGTMYVTTTIKDTGERKQMFGFTARHVIQTIETETTPDACSPSKTKMEMDMWVIDAEFGISCTQNNEYRSYKNTQKSGCQDKIVPKTIGSARSGYPLWQKMTQFDTRGKESFSMIQEVVELSKATLDQVLFEAPADYREVRDASEMYATSGASNTKYNGSAVGGNASTYGTSPYDSTTSGTATTIKSAALSPVATPSSSTPATKPGTVRIGVAVKTTSAGEGISANDLSAAVQNTLGQYLKGTKIEIVPLEAKLAAAQAGEAKEKECDYVILATASHKKGGGGGFGGFGKVFNSVVSQTGVVPVTGAGQVARTAVYTASSMSTNVRSKDEITLDIKVQSAADNSVAFAKQFKAKAKGDGDDIISAVIEQAAQAILDSVGK
ncbi:MAG: hypothetical protein ABL959_02270 [Pyrinomonadaceae bacterium]